MMRLRSLLFCLCLLGAGCDDGTPEETQDLPTDTGSLVAPARDDRSSKSFPPVGTTCSAQQNTAKNLLASHQACTVDADCTVESVAAKCLNAFMCPVPVARDANLMKLRGEAVALAASYRKRCGDVCAIPRCFSPESQRIFCNGETKRCDVALQSAPIEDAGTPTAEPVDPRFACKQDSECAVKNLGNHCGYYPRCANADAVFHPPELDSAICGFPSIHGCACRNDQCVSLQSGREI
jgi:hypothetical protein